MKLWGGASDSGCCSVADVDDARRVAQQLGIVHHVFNFGEEFARHVVNPYVQNHSVGITPNPCIECNRHIKFDRFLERAEQLEFDAIATGHHAQIVKEDGIFKLRRGADDKKDQSYVLHMMGQSQLAKTILPIGHMTKPAVREHAARIGLRTAAKPDSLEVCFIHSTEGRQKFLGDRIPLRPAKVIDMVTDTEVGEVPSVELMTVGQRRGVSPGIDGRARFVVSVDPSTSTVKIGTRNDIMTSRIDICNLVWTDQPVSVGSRVLVQGSAHGTAIPSVFMGDYIEFDGPQRRIAPGQSVVFYENDDVLGGSLAV